MAGQSGSRTRPVVTMGGGTVKIVSAMRLLEPAVEQEELAPKQLGFRRTHDADKADRLPAAQTPSRPGKIETPRAEVETRLPSSPHEFPANYGSNFLL